MWERLRPRSNNRRFLGMVRALAAWREREAQRVNIPRQRLLRDETLLEIAATAPGDPEQLARARGISRGFAEGRPARRCWPRSRRRRRYRRMRFPRHHARAPARGRHRRWCRC